MEPLDVVRQISPTVNTIGAAHYFAPDTLAKGKELGLDGFRFYVLGRGGVLGNVESAVVTAAFAYFHPAVIDKMWTSASATVEPRAAAAAYGECCGALGSAALAGIDGLDGFNDAAETVIDATSRAGLSLFAGWAAEPRSAEPAARALQNANILRELRGDLHIIAVLASGLTAAEAHAVKRPDDVATFGWDPAPVIDDRHRQRHEAADNLTDQLMAEPVSHLSDDQATALVAGVDAIAAALSG